MCGKTDIGYNRLYVPPAVFYLNSEKTSATMYVVPDVVGKYSSLRAKLRKASMSAYCAPENKIVALNRPKHAFPVCSTVFIQT